MFISNLDTTRLEKKKKPEEMLKCSLKTNNQTE
jgi:hypothetical protein